MFTRPPLSYVPMAPALVGVVTGVVFAPYLPSTLVVASIASLALVVAILLTFFRWRTLGRLFLFLALSLLSAWFQRPISVPDRVFDNPDGYPLRGEVTEVNPTDRGSRLNVSAADGFNLMLYLSGRTSFSPGDSVAAIVSLRRPPSPRWPLQYDYASYLARKGVSVSANLPADSLAVVGHSDALRYRLISLRSSLANILRQSPLSDGATRFLVAALLGDSSDILPSDRARFSSAGVAHLLALSGTHVAVVTAIITLFLFPLYLAGRRRLLWCLTLFILWGYAGLTGFSPSVVRAVIMASLLAGSVILARQNSSFNALLAAAVIILLYDASAIRAVGFQLSFLAVAAILIVYRLSLARISPFCPRWAIFILSAIVTTLAATLATAPLSVYYFGLFPLYFLLANIPAMILVGPLLAGGALLLILAPFGWCPIWLCRLVDFIYMCLDAAIGWVTSLPAHVLTGISISPCVALLWLLLLTLFLLWLWSPRSWWSRLSLCLAAVALIVVAIVDRHSRPIPPRSEMFLVNDSRYSGVIYRHDDSAWLVTPEPPAIARMLRDRAARAHRGYLLYAGVDSLRLAPDTLILHDFSRYGRRFRFASDRQMMFLDVDSIVIPDSVGVVLVCRGATGRLRHSIRRARPDSVVMLPSAHWRVARTLSDSLPDIPVISSRATILHRRSL